MDWNAGNDRWESEANEILWNRRHEEKRPSSDKDDGPPSVPLSLSDNYKYSISFLMVKMINEGKMSADSDVLFWSNLRSNR